MKKKQELGFMFQDKLTGQVRITPTLRDAILNTRGGTPVPVNRKSRRAFFKIAKRLGAM